LAQQFASEENMTLIISGHSTYAGRLSRWDGPHDVSADILTLSIDGNLTAPAGVQPGALKCKSARVDRSGLGVRTRGKGGV
jgi:hypothetical protein